LDSIYEDITKILSCQLDDEADIRSTSCEKLKCWTWQGSDEEFLSQKNCEMTHDAEIMTR